MADEFVDFDAESELDEELFSLGLEDSLEPEVFESEVFESEVFESEVESLSLDSLAFSRGALALP